MAPPTDALGSANVVRCTPHHQYMRWRGKMIAPPHGRTEASQCRDVHPRSLIHADPPPQGRHPGPGTPPPRHSLGYPRPAEDTSVPPSTAPQGSVRADRGGMAMGRRAQASRGDARGSNGLLRPKSHRHRHHKTRPRNHYERGQWQHAPGAYRRGRGSGKPQAKVSCGLLQGPPSRLHGTDAVLCRLAEQRTRRLARRLDGMSAGGRRWHVAAAPESASSPGGERQGRGRGGSMGQ